MKFCIKKVGSREMPTARNCDLCDPKVTMRQNILRRGGMGEDDSLFTPHHPFGVSPPTGGEPVDMEIIHQPFLVSICNQFLILSLYYPTTAFVYTKSDEIFARIFI